MLFFLKGLVVRFNMKDHKYFFYNLTLLTIFFTLIFNASFSLAAPYVLLESSSENNDFTFPRISIIEDHFYYNDYFFQGFSTPSKYWVVLLDSNYHELAREVVDESYTVIPFDVNLAYIQIGMGNAPIDTINFTGCNNDGICSPCLGETCYLFESFLTCPSDCPSGSNDSYCDLRNDGICDPDCDLVDADCSDCTACYYSYIEQVQSSCEDDFGGTICAVNEVCLNELIYADDSGSFCCKGKCVLLEKYLKDNFDNVSDSDAEKTNVDVKDISNGDDSIDSTSLNSPTSSLVLLLILVVLLLVLFTALFYYLQQSSHSKDTEKYLLEQIKNLKFRGYSNQMILKVLQEQGYDSKLITKVLNQ